MRNKGLLIVLSGPSGSGKDTVIEKLFAVNENIVKSTSATTRASRENEVNGKDYFFVSEQKFRDMILNDEVLEYTNYCGNYYGTLKSCVKGLLEQGKDVILKIEVQGAKHIKEKYNDAVSIFILPPSMDVLTTRLQNRRTESEESLKMRLSRARKEIEFVAEYDYYDYIVVNDDLIACVNDVCNIIKSEKLRSDRRKNIINEVLL